MYLVDENNNPVEAEFSLDVVDSLPCVVVESSGGANPARGVRRRNPDYNKLMNILFSRLGAAGAKITQIVLDSEKVAGLPVADRVATLDMPYPVDLAGRDVDEFRRMIGRKLANMHRDPAATEGVGNAQKRVRICLDKTVSPDQLLVAPGSRLAPDLAPDFAPNLNETEREYLRAARLGQGKFRISLIRLYSGTCAVTGISNAELLVASHIKPWNACTNSERLDSYNGILLSALVDRLFDRGLITFNDDGTMLVSPRLSEADRKLCNLNATAVIGFSAPSRRYLKYHREIAFRAE